MLNRHINSIQKWYIACITAPLGTAHHAATTQPIPFIQIAIAVGLRTTPKWKCRRSDKTPVSPKRRHPRPEFISLQASLSSLVGNDILPIAPLHTFQSRLFLFQLLIIQWNSQSPYSPSAGNFLEPGQIPGRPALVALFPSQWIDTCVNTEMDNNNKALCWPNGAGSVSL